MSQHHNDANCLFDLGKVYHGHDGIIRHSNATPNGIAPAYYTMNAIFSHCISKINCHILDIKNVFVLFMLHLISVQAICLWGLQTLYREEQ